MLRFPPACLLALCVHRVGSDGGPSDPLLRKWWRGRMGMDKKDQQRFFDCGCLADAMSEDDEDEVVNARS